jgi:hypothetical protein
MTIRIYKSVDFSIRSMTQELPAAARAQIAHIMSKSVEVFLIGNMTKPLPATSTAQIAVCISKSHDF